MRNTEREGLIRFLVPIFLCLPHHLEIHKVSYEGGEGGEGGGGGVPGRALRGQQELAPASPGTHLQVKNWIIFEQNIFLCRNYTTMTVPIIDGIDHETFEYRSVYQDHQHFRGIFEWGMLYKVRAYCLELESVKIHVLKPPKHVSLLVF